MVFTTRGRFHLRVLLAVMAVPALLRLYPACRPAALRAGIARRYELLGLAPLRGRNQEQHNGKEEDEEPDAHSNESLLHLQELARRGSALSYQGQHNAQGDQCHSEHYQDVCHCDWTLEPGRTFSLRGAHIYPPGARIGQGILKLFEKARSCSAPLFGPKGLLVMWIQSNSPKGSSFRR